MLYDMKLLVRNIDFPDRWQTLIMLYDAELRNISRATFTVLTYYNALCCSLNSISIKIVSGAGTPYYDVWKMSSHLLWAQRLITWFNSTVQNLTLYLSQLLYFCCKCDLNQRWFSLNSSSTCTWGHWGINWTDTACHLEFLVVFFQFVVWCDRYTMKCAVVLPKNLNNDIAVTMKLVKLKKEYRIFHTVNRSTLQQTVVHSLRPGDWDFLFARDLMHCHNKSPQTILNPLNYTPVFKKSFTQVKKYQIAYYSILRGAIIIRLNSFVYWNDVLVGFMVAIATNNGIFFIIMTNIQRNCKLTQRLLR